MKKIIMAVPKGRILDELNPILKRTGILPEEDFYSHDSRKLMFETNLKFLNIIRVRSFDVATFVALGAAQIGIAGDDVLNEFNYDLHQHLHLNNVTSTQYINNFIFLPNTNS